MDLSTEHIAVQLLHDGRVAQIQLARPNKHNALNKQMWVELPQVFQAVEQVPTVRVVILCAQGKNFCGGIDISYLQDMFPAGGQQQCPGEVREQLRRNILRLQAAITVVEACKWPVVAAVQGACIGAGVDIITACDIRLCSKDASFSVKEVDMAIAADLGTLQRLPTIVGHGTAMDLALTARHVGADEAQRMGLVSQTFSTPAELMSGAQALAVQLAHKPSLALAGTKRILLHARDNPVDKGLDYIATWNAGMLISDDLASRVALLTRAARRPRL